MFVNNQAAQANRLASNRRTPISVYGSKKLSTQYSFPRNTGIQAARWSLSNETGPVGRRTAIGGSYQIERKKNVRDKSSAQTMDARRSVRHETSERCN